MLKEENISKKEKELKKDYEEPVIIKKDLYAERRKKLSIILNIVILLIIMFIIFATIDTIRVKKYNEKPLFAVNLHTYKDGGTKEYYGVGYKVISYNQVQGRKDKVIGTYFLKYNVEPTNLESLDLALEFNNDEASSYKKYYKQFVRITSTLEEVNKKDNTINIGYKDPGKKYSLDIICNMNNKNTSNLNLNKEITVIGTITKYEAESKNKVGKLVLSNCFAEQ